MRCLHPLEVPVYADGKKTRQFHLVPCGKCYACCRTRQLDWMFRLNLERKKCVECVFLTLTYDDSNVPTVTDPASGSLSQTLRKEDLQKYFKRLRKRYPPKSIRYLACGEYGSRTLRPHYHAIIFRNSVDGEPEPDFKLEESVQMDWPFGFVSVGSVTDASIAYTTKYCLKEGSVPPGGSPTFSLMSTKPALGSSYVEDDKFVNFHLDHPFVVLPGGVKQRLPRYYQNKLNVHSAPADELPMDLFMLDEYLKLFPDGKLSDFYIWRANRVEQYEQNKLKRSKHNSIL